MQRHLIGSTFSVNVFVKAAIYIELQKHDNRYSLMEKYLVLLGIYKGLLILILLWKQKPIWSVFLWVRFGIQVERVTTQTFVFIGTELTSMRKTWYTWLIDLNSGKCCKWLPNCIIHIKPKYSSVHIPLCFCQSIPVEQDTVMHFRQQSVNTCIASTAWKSHKQPPWNLLITNVPR